MTASLNRRISLTVALWLFTGGFALSAAGAAPEFDEIIPTSQRVAAEWRMTLQPPGRQWAQPDFDDSAWQAAPAPFGAANTPGISPRTRWESSDIWLRRRIKLPGDAARLKNVGLLIFHDEDIEAYIDGVAAARQSGFNSAYEPLALAPAAAAVLRPGAEVVLAVHCRQTAGGQGVDIGLITLDPALAARMEADRRKQEYRNFAQSHAGDAAAGRALFLDEQRVGCTRCHSANGAANRAGPDLSTAGDKFPRPDLIEAILNPSQVIAVGYGMTVVKTKSSEVIEGIVKEASDKEIALMGGDGQLRRIPVGQISQRRDTRISMMPEGLESGLSHDEFANLIAYVETLRLPESAAANRQGMPATIPEIDSPATLRPIHPEALRFNHASWMGQIPGKPDAFLVAEHETGKVWLLQGRGSSAKKTPWIDIRSQVYPAGATGLIDGVFHPNFVTNRKYYLQHETMVGGTLMARVSEYVASEDLQRDSGQAGRVVFEVPCVTVDHAGGGLAFARDGSLYVGMGDTGPQRDPQGHGQDLNLMLGKILRIDIDHPDGDRPYSIPKDNPFVGKPGVRPEIWAYGFRQPWRFSFDPATGDLWVGDVGQDRIEEIDIVRPGENHGWNVMEGFSPFSNRFRREGETFTPPVFAYERRYGNSVTGGYVYHGKSREFDGVYICGDYNSKRIWALWQNDRKLTAVRQIAMAPQTVVSFAQGEDGEIYVLSYEGTAYHLDLSTAKLPPRN